MYKAIAFLIVFFILIFIFTSKEPFKVGEPESSEYIPQNMSVTEFKTINKWDYPGYLN